MVKSELHLSDKEREVFLEAAMVHLKTAFCKSPEVLDAVNVNFLVYKGFIMTNTSYYICWIGF